MPYHGVAWDDGTIWHATVQISAVTYLSDPAESGIKFLQAASAYRKRLLNGNIDCETARTAQSAGWQRDGGDPPTRPLILDTPMRVIFLRAM